MWERLAKNRIEELSSLFPGTLILGARQVGKTTLSRATYPKAAYCDLEEPLTRDLFRDAPSLQIESRASDATLILDEAQSVPDVFPALRGIIDSDRKTNGRFLLLGSAQPSLIKQVSETLTGRIGVVILEGLTAKELSASSAFSYQEHWLKGGFPDAYAGNFREWWEAYLATFIERDLPALGVERDPSLARQMLQYLAHLHGKILNASSVGRDLGISYHTVNRYIGIFEQTFLLRRLQPYFKNVGKRLTKSPKIYLRDSGLLHHLLNVSNLDELATIPGRGASWEGYVLEEILRREALARPSTQFYFWRTAAGAEADLLLESSKGRFLYEVKSASGAKPGNAKKLESILSDVEANAGWIIDQSKERIQLAPKISSVGFESCIATLPHWK